MEQKIKDFEILYSVLKENYPYFGVNKRLHNIDWLSNKAKYLEQIKMTKTDLQYLKTLKNILTDLNDGHVSFLPTKYHNNYYRVYTGIEEKENDGFYKPWIEELEKVDKRINYWTDLYDTLTVDTSHQSNSQIKGNKKEIKYHLKLSTFNDSKIALLKISTFNYFNIEKDRDTIFHFLKTLKDYKHLIIDVQDNGGGATNYWKDNIVAHLIKDTIIYEKNRAIKDGRYTNMFFKHSITEKKRITAFDTNFNFPPELKNDNFYIYSINDTIIPSQFAGFTGDIYLLVNNVVYSSSESLAIFCKATNWATVVGEKTNGGGGGVDPLLLALPESGLIIVFSGEMGLNPDGTSNNEKKTIPDIEIKAENSQERLDKLVDYINSKF